VRAPIEGIGGGPLISSAASTSVAAEPTGSASGCMTIALDAREADCSAAAADRSGRGRVAAPDDGHRRRRARCPPQNGAVATQPSLCGLALRHSHPDLFVVAAAGPLLALSAVLVVATTLGTF